jgi:hypothetical protein
MRINEVQAQVRYSSEVRGSWVTIELGSTASLTNSEETLESVSDELYARLSKQLKILWASNKAGGGEAKAETQGQPGNNPTVTKEHWCEAHQTQFKRHEKDGNVWYSHRLDNGGWHNE